MKNKNNIFLKFLIIFNGIILVYFSLVFVGVGNIDKFIILIVFSILCISLSYVLISRRYEKKMSNTIDKINKFNFDMVNTNRMDIKYILDDETLEPFYDSLTAIGEWMERQEETYSEILELVNSVALNMDLDKLFDGILPKLLEVTESSCGAFYLVNNANNRLEIKSSIGFSKNIYSEFDIAVGEGFIGSSLRDNKIKIIKDIPEDTIYYIRSFLGKIKPKNIMVVPVSDNESIVGMLLLASIYEYQNDHNSIINIIRSYIGVAVSNALTFERTKRLTNELKFQNRLIQDLNDDLEKKVESRTLFLNSVIDSIEDYAIYALDKEFRITAWNKGAENILGYTFKEVNGRGLEAMYTKDEIESKQMKNLFVRLQTDGKVKDQGWRRKKDGTLYYADSTFFKMTGQNGEVLGFTNVIRDITALRKAEDDLWIERGLVQKVFDSSSRCLVVTDSSGVIQLYNRNAYKMLGSVDLLGKNIGSFFEDSIKLLDNFDTISESCINTTLEFKLKDSEEKVNLKIQCLTDKAELSVKLFIHLKLEVV